MEEELFSIEASVERLASTILRLFGLEPPLEMPPPINLFDVIKKNYNQIILIILDNFGLFECVYYKPEFLITMAKAVILLNTTNPFSKNIINNIIYAGEKQNRFNLITHLNNNDIKTVMIGNQKDIEVFNENSETKITKNDTETFVQSIKFLNRTNFIWLHFLDFEKMYHTYNFQPPSTIAKKLITRTDRWILTLHKQLLPNSLILVVGNHGRVELDLKLEGKFKRLRGASVPIAVLIEK
ncbi:MAG: hypothetical protein ACTSYQ_03270 [Candidatus Odinarchaeia archaeon]